MSIQPAESSRRHVKIAVFITASGLLLWGFKSAPNLSSESSAHNPEFSHIDSVDTNSNNREEKRNVSPLSASRLNRAAPSADFQAAENAHKFKLLLHARVNREAGILSEDEKKRVMETGDTKLLLGLMMVGEYPAGNFFAPAVFPTLNSQSLATLLTNPDLTDSQRNECVLRLIDLDPNDSLPGLLNTLREPLSGRSTVVNDADVAKYGDVCRINTDALLVSFCNRDPDLVAAYSYFNSASPWSPDLRNLLRKLDIDSDLISRLKSDEDSREAVLNAISSIAGRGGSSYDEYQEILEIQEKILSLVHDSATDDHTALDQDTYGRLSLLYALPEIRLMLKGQEGIAFEESIRSIGTLGAVELLARTNPEILHQSSTVFNMSALFSGRK